MTKGILTITDMNCYQIVLPKKNEVQMYKIEKQNYGYKLTFGGQIGLEEMSVWVNEAKAALEGQSGSFSVFVDMRELLPLAPESQQEMTKGQALFKQKGMARSVVILNNALTTMQFKRLAKESGIYEWERYIDASKTANWEEAGIAWLTQGTDPDL